MHALMTEATHVLLDGYWRCPKAKKKVELFLDLEKNSLNNCADDSSSDWWSTDHTRRRKREPSPITNLTYVAHSCLRKKRTFFLEREKVGRIGARIL